MLKLHYADMVSFAEDGSSGDRRLVESYPRLLRELMRDNLTKKQKCYIIMYYRDGLTVMEIAERFGVNKSTVSRTIHRGRARLANAIKCELIGRRIALHAEQQSPDTEDEHGKNADS